MKTICFLSMVVFAACAGSQGPEGPQGTQGPQGAVGAQGSAGTPGTDAPRIVWKDANGTPIPNIVEVAGAVRYVDPNGVFWSFDAINNVANPVSAFVQSTVYWANTGCTGSFFIRPLAQHIAIELLGVGVIVTRPDGLMPLTTSTATLSLSAQAGCFNASQNQTGLVPGSAHTIVTVPTVTATAPFHPELMN